MTRHSILKSSSSVGLTTLISRVFGLVRDILIAATLGATGPADAFLVAFKIPNLLRRFVAEGSLSAAFVPVFTEAVEKKQSLREAVSFVLLLTIPLVLLGIVFSKELVYAFAPGFTGEKLELSAELTRITFGFVLLVSLTALLSSALNTLGFFCIPASPPIFLNLALIGAVLVFSGSTAHVLAWAVLAGGFLGLLPQIYLLLKQGYQIAPTTVFKTDTCQKLIKLMIPSVFSASLYQLAIFINTILASTLPSGSVSWLYYADRLFQFPMGVLTIAIATAALPRLSSLVVEKKYEELRNKVREILLWVFWLTLPAAAGLFVLSEELIKLFYLRGEFSSKDVFESALALRYFAFGLPPISAQVILVRLFLANKDAKTPALVTGISLTANILLSLSLMGSTTAPGIISEAQQVLELADLDHGGLALSSSLSSAVAVIVLGMIARKRNMLPSAFSFLADGIKCFLCASVMTCLLLYVNTGHVLIQCLTGGVYFIIVSWLLNPLQFRSVLKRITSKKRLPL